MIPRTFDEIGTSDIEALIRNQVRESRDLDYKEALPGNADDEKKEFLRDVISLANAGGDLLFGIREARDAAAKTTGLADPGAPVGLSFVTNADAEIRRLDDIITHGIAPRIAGVRIKAVEGFSDGLVIVVRVPRSWIAPHMLTFKTKSPFLTRRSGSRIEMDVTDLRAAFLAQAAVGERIEEFRRGRLEMIASGATGVERRDSSLLIIHVVPLAATDPLNAIDISKAGREIVPLKPIGAYTYDHRYNFDGFTSFAKGAADGTLSSYMQVFRSGTIEAVGPARVPEPQHTTLQVTGMESDVLEVVYQAIGVQRRLGIEPPTSVLVALANVEGYRFSSANPWLMDGGNRPIDRATLLLPEILFQEVPTDKAEVAVQLRHAFDALWQAAGFPKCFEYDDRGAWNPMRQGK